MFCENCGTRVEDGQPFCPNCGSKMPVPEAPAAPVNPGLEPNVDPGYIPPVAPVTVPKSTDGLLGKINAMPMMEKILFLCTGGLLVLCFILSMIKLLSAGYFSAPLAYAAPFFTTVITVLFTLAITFFVLDYFDWFNLKFLWFFIAGAAATILLIFIIIWIDSECKLTVGGWFFLLMQVSLTAAAVMLLIEKLKKK